MNKNVNGLKLLFLGFFISSIIGFTSFLFLILEGFLVDVLWHGDHDISHDNTYIFVICIIGWIIMSSLKNRWGQDIPKTAHTSMEELKLNRTLNYNDIFRNMLSALLILILGAGVGPEATLLSIVISFSVWEADKLRYFYYNADSIKKLSFIEKLKCLVSSDNCLYRYDENRAIPLKKKKMLVSFFIINGLISFIILMKMTGQPSFITKMGSSFWNRNELWLILPLVLYGILFGSIFNSMSKFIKKCFKKVKIPVILKTFIGSASIFIVAVLFPNLLFSGQHSLHLVTEIGINESFMVLFSLSAIKLIFLEICLNTGWTGGNIFPVVFSAILQGFAIAKLVPGMDTVFVVSVVSISIVMTIIKKPILSGLFVSLFFPIVLLPIEISIITLFTLFEIILKKSKIGKSSSIH